jgi:tripartite-type tricarboxylate transporter receptor subunit TctC
VKPYRVELKDANEFVAQVHRHHKPVRGHRFSLGAEHDDKLCGVAICGRPVARAVNAKKTLEITRVATDGTKNACTFLLGAAVRVAREMGFSKVQTYILDSETGVSLKAAGFEKEADVVGRQWEHTAGPRRTDQPTCNKERWSKIL